jgi:ubiquitin carboxyl-terminal hydrolase 8
MNACIQIFSHTFELHSILDKLNLHLTKNFKKEKYLDLLILFEWNNLRKLLWEKNSQIIRPLRFFQTVQYVAKQKNLNEFLNFSQTDIQEFILFLVNCFHESISRKIRIDVSGDAINKTDTLAKICYEMVKQRYENDYSEFWNLFYAIQVSEIYNADTNELFSQKPESYFIIDLPITNSSLLNCLEDYVKGEYIEGYYHEEKKRTFNIYKKLIFWSFPTILVICLKRFKETLKKNRSYIDFPQELDLSSFVIGYEKLSFIYSLYGICNHFGNSLTSGHYTSYIKNLNNSWYEFNDNSVIEIDRNCIVTPNAYVLFYQKNRVQKVNIKK